MLTVTARYLLSFFMTISGLNGFLSVAHHLLPTLILARRYKDFVLNSQYRKVVVFLRGTKSRAASWGSMYALAPAMLTASSASCMSVSLISQHRAQSGIQRTPSDAVATPPFALSKAHLVSW